MSNCSNCSTVMVIISGVPIFRSFTVTVLFELVMFILNNKKNYFLMASNNIDSAHVCHVIMYRYFLIRARDSDV